MKKTLLAALTLSAASGLAHADGEVSVYGILDVGIVGLTHAGNFSPNFVTSAVPIGAQPAKIGTAVGMMTGGQSQTRLGFKGSEDLGDGNKAFFQLESAFNLGSGNLATSGLAGAAGTQNMVADTSLNGQLFNRMALLGLSRDGVGAVSFGRQNSLQLNIIGSGYDPVNAQMFSPINFSGSYGGGGATDNSRVDNAVKYAGKFGSVNVNALYGFGGVPSNMAARGNAQLNVGYEADSFGIQAAMQNTKDTTSIAANAAPDTVTATFENLTSYMLAGRWQVIDPLTLKAGYEKMQISAPGNPTGDAAMTQIYNYQLTGATMFSGPEKNINVYWLGGNYQFTPAIKASLGFYDAKTPAYGATTVDLDDKYYSAFVEYNFSKNTNAYAGVMMDKKSSTGATYAPPIPDTFTTYGVGLRHMF